MKAYLALIQNDIRLAFRQKVVIFFNYLMPFMFFFIFAQSFHAEQGGAILQVFTMVTVIGILGNGMMGAGMRAVQDRETNILRRYKVAPISALPMLVASTVTGLVVYMPFVIMMLILAQNKYGMQIPQHVGAMMIFILLGVVAIRSIGLILSSVVNSMAEAQILVQILYIGMLLLSGATFPLSILPDWLFTITQFIPSTHLVTGLQGIMMRNETLLDNWQATGALILTTVIGLFLSVKLFRWEKEEKIKPLAKLWILAVLLPFIALGTWQAHAKDNAAKAKILTRDFQRSRTQLIRNARIFTGDGRVIENGAVLVKAGKIAEIYDGNIPDPKAVNAEAIEAAGKTLLPGLIDTHVHLGAPGGVAAFSPNADPEKAMERELAAYLYSGVTAVRSLGDGLDISLKVRELVNSGEKQGAEFFAFGPLFTAPGGHGTEYMKNLPSSMRQQAEAQNLRMPGTPEEAKHDVDALKAVGIDGIKAILETGAGAATFKSLDPRILDAIAGAAKADGLPITVHTGDARDVEEALNAHVNGIEHGSLRERIPDEDFARMAKDGVTYDPTLSVGEALVKYAAGDPDLLNRSLVQQVVPKEMLAATRKSLGTQKAPLELANMEVARDNLLRAFKAGVTLVTGSDAGNMLVFHGPTVQHEVMLWVQAGIPVDAALRAATLNAAKALRADQRFGSITKGKDATLLAVDGNPLQDIKVLESISFVMFKGERVARQDLLKPE
ncbi:MAG TPA: amidohydrolase family protein [Bryobacteraceae bacterium]|jgi:imidazolonepropionase-like amidohydrolase/ABC-type multidrug transport system permease subunit|nr:amidohydrolase family protein [Bryobacteraceae bacterium]